MAGTWNVSASYDKSSYNAGETMIVSVAGSYVVDSTTTTEQQSGSLTLTLTAADGTITSVALPPVPVTVSVPGQTEVAWTVTEVSDTSGRNWTVAPDGKSVSAVA